MTTTVEGFKPLNPPSVISSFHKCLAMWRGGGRPTASPSMHSHHHPSSLHICERTAHFIGPCVCHCGVAVMRIRRRARR